MKNALIDQLVHYLMEHRESWIAKGELTRMIWTSSKGRTFLPETVGRELRRAEEASRIAVRPHGISIEYRWLPHEHRPRYVPTSRRTNQCLIFKKAT